MWTYGSLHFAWEIPLTEGPDRLQAMVLQRVGHRRITDTRSGASQVALVVTNLPANAGDIGEGGLIPGSGRPPAGGNGNAL